MGAAEVGDFLSHLAVTGNVAASTQNQALNALVFLYKAVLDQPLGDLHGVVRAKSHAGSRLCFLRLRCGVFCITSKVFTGLLPACCMDPACG